MTSLNESLVDASESFDLIEQASCLGQAVPVLPSASPPGAEEHPESVPDYIKAVLAGLPWAIACYIGFVEFVIFSTNILLTHLASLLSNSIARWDDLIPQILFFLVMIPVLQIFFNFVVRIFVSFFHRFSSLATRGFNFSSDNKIARFLQKILYVLISLGLISNLILALIIFLQPSLIIIHVILSTIGMILAILCAISLVLAFLRIQCSAWLTLIGFGRFEYPRASWVNPFDMAGLLTDQTLVTFVDDPSSPLRSVSRRRERWSLSYKLSLLASLICFWIFVAYFVLDIQRERKRAGYERSRQQTADQLYRTVARYVCRSCGCTDACNRTIPDPACGPGDWTTFCKENCTPGVTPVFSSLGDGVPEGAIAVRLVILVICLPMMLSFHPLVALFRFTELRRTGLLASVISGLVFLRLV
jgi:hypothetical protein